ncbi:MAG: winged helix-turn-helix domain-containing protein [Anaerolineae bacterium]
MATCSGQALDITRTEFAILEALMSTPNYAFTRAELVEKALGFAYEGQEQGARQPYQEFAQEDWRRPV